MATINTSPELKVVLNKLKAAIKFAQTKEDIQDAVSSVLGIDASNPSFNTLVDKLSIKQGIQSQIATYHTDFVNVFKAVDTAIKSNKLRYIGKGNSADAANRLSDGIFAQFKRAKKLTMQSLRKVVSDNGFITGTNLKSVTIFVNACKLDSQIVNPVQQQVIVDRVATQKIQNLYGAELINRINQALKEFENGNVSFPTPKADVVGIPQSGDYETLNDFLDAVTEYKYAWEEDLANYLGFATAKEMLFATNLGEDADWKLFQSFSDNFIWDGPDVVVQKAKQQKIKVKKDKAIKKAIKLGIGDFGTISEYLKENYFDKTLIFSESYFLNDGTEVTGATYSSEYDEIMLCNSEYNDNLINIDYEDDSLCTFIQSELSLEINNSNQ